MLSSQRLWPRLCSSWVLFMFAPGSWPRRPWAKRQENRIDRALLVHIDQHPALDGIPDARALDLTRLEYHVAVGQNHGQPQCGEVRDRLEGARVQAIRERILEHE